MKLTKNTYIVLVIIGVIIIMTQNKMPFKTQPDKDLDTSKLTRTEWQAGYIMSAELSLPNYADLIANTEYYDYDHQSIIQAAEYISSLSETPKEAVVNTLEYVYQNTRYVSNEPDSECYDGTAPIILAKGQGQCDTQSILVVSILRRLGIASQPVGGCILTNDKCRLTSLFLKSFKGFREPQFSQLPVLDPYVKEYSRGQTFSGLHAWASAWLPEDGWIVLDSTTGQIGNTECYYYHVEIFPENDEKEDICISKNWNYAQSCKVGNLGLLDVYGEGIFGEVTP